MAAEQNPVAYWRPAPFPVYAPDRRRRLVEYALALCCLLVFAAALMPRPAGHDATFLVPVAYHRLQLKLRAPALIELGLPPGDYAVEPQSLGYFKQPGEFVYTAAVERGLIFGTTDGEAFILELAAPEESEAFLEFHLDQIREGVLEQNRLANLIAQARASLADAPGRVDSAVISEFEQLGADAIAAGADQAQALADAAQAGPAEAVAALERYAPRQAALKQRYYACQRARLDVLGQQAALQLALARLPEPPGTELLSLGDTELVAGTLERELAGIEDAWRERLRMLQVQLAAAPLDVMPAVVSNGLGGVLPPLPVEHAPAPGIADVAQAMHSAQRAIATTEALELRQSLERLAQVRSRALTGRPPGWTNLPRLSFTPRKLAEPSLAALPGYGELLGIEGDTASILGLVRQLACRFEGRQAVEDEGMPRLAQQGHPFELPYGLLAVDLASRRDKLEGATTAGIVGTSPDLEDKGERIEQAPYGIEYGLAEMLDDPDRYGLAALDLAYLRCLAWYARLGRDMETQAGAAALAGRVGAGVASFPAEAVLNADENRDLPFE